MKELYWVRRRRSVRRFTPEPVAEEELDFLLKCAMMAPSRLNRRPWHFVVIRDSALQDRLAEKLRVHPYLEEAPIAIALCADPRVSTTWMLDVAAAAENLLLCASDIDLGAIWVGDPGSVMWEQSEEVLRAELQMPEHIRVLGLVAVGHPVETLPLRQLDERFEPHKIHYDGWNQLHSPA